MADRDAVKRRRSKSAERVQEERYQQKQQEAFAAHAHPRMTASSLADSATGSRLESADGGPGLQLRRTVFAATRVSATATSGTASASSAFGSSEFDVALSLTSGLFAQQEGKGASASAGLGLPGSPGFALGRSARGAADDDEDGTDDEGAVGAAGRARMMMAGARSGAALNSEDDEDDDDDDEDGDGGNPIQDFKFMDVGRAMHRRALRYAESLARGGDAVTGVVAVSSGPGGSGGSGASAAAAAAASDDIKGAVAAELAGTADASADAKLGGHSRIGRDFQADIPALQPRGAPAASAAASSASAGAAASGAGAGGAGSGGSSGGGSSSSGGAGAERKLLLGTMPSFPADARFLAAQQAQQRRAMHVDPVCGSGSSGSGSGSSRVGSAFQADIPDLVGPPPRAGAGGGAGGGARGGGAAGRR